MSDPVKAAARAAGWTILQALTYLAVFEAGKAMWAAASGWHGDLRRGVLWWYAFWLFVGFGLAANAALATKRLGSSLPKRLAVWSGALLPLVVFTLPSVGSVPLAVVLVWGCAVVAVAVREGLGRFAQRPRLFASRGYASL